MLQSRHCTSPFVSPKGFPNEPNHDDHDDENDHDNHDDGGGGAGLDDANDDHGDNAAIRMNSKFPKKKLFGVHAQVSFLFFTLYLFIIKNYLCL